MACKDPKTNVKKWFLGREEGISPNLCLPIWFFLGQQQGIYLGNTLIPLLCFQLRKKVDLFGNFLSRTAVGNLKLGYAAVADSLSAAPASATA